MHGKDFDIRTNTAHRIRFTRDAFSVDNRMLINLLETNGHAKVLVFIDGGVAEAFPGRFKAAIGHGVQDWMRSIGEQVESPLTLLRETTVAVTAPESAPGLFFAASFFALRLSATLRSQ